LFKGGIVGLKKGCLEWQLIHLLIEGGGGWAECKRKEEWMLGKL